MVNGRFVVYGSPSHLKQAYGHGYTLIIRQNEHQVEACSIPDFMETTLQNATLSSQTKLKDGSQGMEYSYKVTLSQFGTKLSGMFDILSNLLKESKIQDFNLTRTTLEQVFMSFARF
jgi:hypothetical protein